MSLDLKVVSNSGPLMVLAKLNLLYLLKGLYGRVYYGESVYDELVAAGIPQGYQDAQTLKTFLEREGWQPENIQMSNTPKEIIEVHLDRGERDTLSLALLLGSKLVLMDENEGRKVARSLGLTVKGSLGILVEAYQRKIMGEEQFRLNLLEIADRKDIWISTSLTDQILDSIKS